MRIRKRQVPLPLSSLSPVPLSDPLFLLKSPPPPPPRIDPGDLPPAGYFQEEDGKGRSSSNYHHFKGPDYAADNALAGSSPAAEAVKRRSLSNDDDGEEFKWDAKVKGSPSGNNSGKRRGRAGVGIGGGGANSEGSRCSRVNGRGWRCGKLTLVGYSLCEHHLGKGRLRSMANVRGRSAICTMETPRNDDNGKPQQTPETPPGNIFPGDSEEEDDDEKDEDLASTGGPRKKARSMSSLLGQKVSDRDDDSARAHPSRD